MSRVSVSPKYQVVIPKDVRERMSIAPGDRLEVLALGNRIEFIQVPPMAEMRGCRRGQDNDFQRDKEDRCLP